MQTGRELVRLGQLENGEKVLREAIDLIEGPDGDEISPMDAAAAYYELAVVLSMLGRHMEALPYLQLSHSPFKGKYGGEEETRESVTIPVQPSEDNGDLPDSDDESRDASDSSGGGTNLDIQPLDSSLVEVMVDGESRADTASTIESQSTDNNYDDFYDALRLANVKVNLPLRASKSSRSYLGADGAVQSAGTRLEGGFENDVSRVSSAML